MLCKKCKNLKNVVERRVIYCVKRGKTHPRRSTCNQYIPNYVQKYDFITAIEKGLA